ncbi:MAG: OB-fold domain-containing protein, partial [Chloroflexota bacterium]|nr:OB-fold domain-containing protein [Chloroflexota bacterium]
SLDIWRKAGDRFPQGWEDRFVFELYAEQVRAAVSGLLDRLKLAPGDFARTAWYGHDRRGQGTAARALGFDPSAQINGSLFDTAGNTGAALAPMMLVEALEETKAGDRLLMVSYGDGCDTLALRVGAEKQGGWHSRGIKGHLGSKLSLGSYGKYLRFRDLCEWAPERRPPDRSAPTALHRDRSQIYPLKGQRCRRCGGIQYAIISRGRVCTWCQARDDFEEIRLSDKRGTLFTFSMDQRAMEVELPNVLCVVDLEGGGRFYGQMTDREPEKLEVGMPVELTFRRIHGGSGLHNYFWKVRPIRVP